MTTVKRSKPFMGDESEPEFVDAEDRIPMRHNFTKTLIMVAHYYGIGDTVEEAKAEIKKIRGRALKVKEPQVWWVVPDDARVSDIDGTLFWDKSSSKPFEINRIDGK